MKKTEATIRILAVLRGNVNRPAAEIVAELAKEGMTITPRQVYSAREVYRRSKIRSKKKRAAETNVTSTAAARLETIKANKDKPLRYYILECLNDIPFDEDGNPNSSRSLEEISRFALNNGYITNSSKFDWALRKLLSDMERAGIVEVLPNGQFTLSSRMPVFERRTKLCGTKDYGVGTLNGLPQYDEFSCLEAVRDLSKKVGGLDKLSKYVSFLNELHN